LREHRRGAGALRHPHEDQDGGIGGQAADQRAEAEHGDPEQEQSLVAVGLTQPRAGDQQHGEGDQVATDHQLDSGG